MARKGQMVFEFIIATMLFIAVVFFVILMLSGMVSSYAGGHYSNLKASEAMRISEMLTHSPGVWVGGVPLQPGLAEEWPVLNDSKVAYMGAYCRSSGPSLARMLDLKSREGLGGISMVVSNSSGVVMSCSTSAAAGEQAHVDRFAFSEASGLLRVGVGVW